MNANHTACAIVTAPKHFLAVFLYVFTVNGLICNLAAVAGIDSPTAAACTISRSRGDNTSPRSLSNVSSRRMSPCLSRSGANARRYSSQDSSPSASLRAMPRRDGT